MKREILFKAKRVEDGKWIEGDLIQNDKHTSIRLKTYRANNGWFTYDVHPETVCQFTGLLDKNGNKIFEGDMIKPKSYHPTSEVFFMNGSFKVNGKMGKIGFGSWSKSVEIIGNIHD